MWPQAFKAVVLLVFPLSVSAQDAGDFWSHIRYGGTVGASFGSDYTDLVAAPGALYNFNEHFAAGCSLQGSYVKLKDAYESWMYGGSLIGIFSPVEEVQLSVELEQLRVNNTFKYPFEPEYTDNFWNTALFVGAGYNTGNVTLGIRFNLLFDEDKFVYNEAFMPFVRVYF